jgi:hypothetical protein
MVVASLLLPLAYACSSDDQAGDDMAKSQLPTSNQYINLNIVVSSGSEGTMRGPAGGEEGDGREAGSERENLVTGVTIMLYEDGAGINTAAETKLAFCKYYPVSLVSRETAGTPYATKEDEAVYTTGDQPLVGSGLDMSKEYHAIVVANQNMASTFTTASKVKDVRDYVTTHVYSGSGLGADASHFVMSLETDYTVNFASPSSKTTVGNKTTYNFDGIRIERLAARVDFWTKTATYGEKDALSNDYNAPGYVYPVWKTSDTTTPTSTDKFVLTAVTPFNLYNSNEYLFKRTNDAAPYLAVESITNYVIDPNTATKTAASPTYYNNMLSYLVGIDETNLTLSAATGYFQATKNLYVSTTQKAGFTGDDSKDNFILCYPRENTLSTSSPLYYYATGVAIEGDYYPAGSAADLTKAKHFIYYGYLRHQGEGTGPYTIKMRTDLSTTETYPSTTPMNFGVVRNNIYRLSIDKITEKGELELKIMVKKWDTFTHSWIYM